MKYAVVLTGGKQYRVSEGDTVAVDRLSLQPNDTYTFSEVLLVVDDAKRSVGTPTVAGAQVKATVIEEKKTRKIRVATFKAKAKFRKVRGHRSVMTHVKIDKIEAGASKK